jgi:hypothetical protein
VGVAVGSQRLNVLSLHCCGQPLATLFERSQERLSCLVGRPSLAQPSPSP